MLESTDANGDPDVQLNIDTIEIQIIEVGRLAAIPSTI